MRQLIKVIIDNFRSMKHVEFDVDGQGLTLISGANYDDILMAQNGAGKTTLLYSICWGLYGQTPIGEKGDDVLPHFDPKNTCVTLIFKDETDVITISRYRKHREHENNIVILANGHPVNVVDNKDAQSQIEKYVGFDYDVFCLLLTTGSISKNAKPIMLMGDTELKEFTDRLLNLKYLQTAHDIVQEKISVKEKAVMSMNAAIEANKESLKIVNEQTQAALTAKQAYEEYRKENISKNNEMIAAIDASIATLQMRVVELEAQRDLIVIPTLDYTRLNELKAYLDTVNQQQEAIRGEIDALSNKKAAILTMISEQSISEKERAEVAKTVDASAVQDLHAQMKNIENEIRSWNYKIESLKTQKVTPSDADAKALSEKYNSLQRLKYEIDLIDPEIKKIDADISKYSNLANDAVCPTCGQTINEQFVLNILNGFESMKQTKNALKEERKSAFKIAKDEYLKMQTDANNAAAEVIRIQIEQYQKAILDKDPEKASLDEQLRQANEDYSVRLQTAIEQAFMTKLVEYRTAVEVIDADILKKQLQSKEILDIINDVKKSIEDESKTMETQIVLFQKNTKESNEIAQAISTKKAEINTANTQKKFYTDMLEKMNTESNPHESTLNSLAAKYQEISLKQKDLSLRVSKDESEIKNLKFWEVGFSSKGIKSFVLDSVKSLLDLKGNYCLSKLSNELYLKFETQDELKSGEKRDKFTINIYKRGVKTRYQFMALSKGERARVSLAVTYAMKFLAEYYNNVKLNFDFYDEALDGMDDTGCEHVINFLREELDRFSSIFIITFNAELKRLCDRSLVVRKSGGVSEIKIE